MRGAEVVERERELEKLTASMLEQRRYWHMAAVCRAVEKRATRRVGSASV